MDEERRVYRVLMGKREGNRPLGKPRRRWENNIKMGLQEVGWFGGNGWCCVEDSGRWLALVSTVTNLRVP
jgi:hypothetical protein